MSAQSNAGGGIGILGMLFILFTALKLTNVISWSWAWVTAPLWGMPALIAGGFGVYVAVAMPLNAIKRRKNRKLAEAKRAQFMRTMEGPR